MFRPLKNSPPRKKISSFREVRAKLARADGGATGDTSTVFTGA